MIVVVTTVVAPIILINRLMAGADGPTLADIFAIPVDPPWPRGVQEEEPVRWHVERLTRQGADRAAKPGAAGVARPAVETGPCA